MKYINREDGLSLVEVLASLVIISIILISFVQLFVQMNKTVIYNNEKLVLINLANAELERLKLIGYDSTKLPTVSEFQNDYEVVIKDTPDNSSDEDDENWKKLGLVNVTVTVISPNNKSKAEVEGFVQNVETNK